MKSKNIASITQLTTYNLQMQIKIILKKDMVTSPTTMSPTMSPSYSGLNINAESFVSQAFLKEKEMFDNLENNFVENNKYIFEYDYYESELGQNKLVKYKNTYAESLYKNAFKN